MGTPEGEATDEVSEALGHQLRRESVRYLERQRGKQTPLSELAEHLERRESTSDAERVKLQLHHRHLPKLETLGWLEYDSERGQITYHGHEGGAQILSDTIAILDA